MPPLTGEAERFAPRATGFCIDERRPSPGRSRSWSLASPSRVSSFGIACSAFRLAWATWQHFQRAGTALRMLDEPSALVMRVMDLLPLYCGQRSRVLWTCLYQLQTRSRASKLSSGVRTRPPVCFQESNSNLLSGFSSTFSRKGATPPRLLHYQQYPNSHAKSS